MNLSSLRVRADRLRGRSTLLIELHARLSPSICSRYPADAGYATTVHALSDRNALRSNAGPRSAC